MLGLVAAQLKHKVDSKEIKSDKPIWVDVSLSTPCEGNQDTDSLDWRRNWVSFHLLSSIAHVPRPNATFRYNIEAMSQFLPVDQFFSHVYLVDFSPSLCNIARERFQRLGWKNVSVVCQDARTFRLPEESADPLTPAGADVITMSYSLSMIPGQWPS